MKLSAKTAAVKARSILFPSALLFVLIPILFYTDITRAQSETGQTLNAPVLTANLAGANTVELSWNAVSGAVRYDLWAWTRADGWEQLDEGDLTGTSYTHNRLMAGMTYYYAVRAVDADGGASTWSEYIHATTNASASKLAIPQLTVLATEDGIHLTWGAVPLALRYQIAVWWDRETGWQLLGGHSLTGTTYTHADARPGTTYYYSIRALSAAGEASGWLLDYPFATALPVTSTPTVTPTVEAQRGALIALYEATSGDNWTRNENWLTDKPIDLWYGVSANSNGRVMHLRLFHNGLHGTIPDLSALSSLTFLDLRGNRLTGQVPDLSPLPNLTHLDLRTNELSGSIPDLGVLSSLTHLDLGFNRLSGSIPDLGALANLTFLSLRANRLTGGIPDLSALSSLKRLHLGNNQLSGQFPDLSALNKLTVMVLGDNRLAGPLTDLSALANLTHLDLRRNELSGPIPDLSALTNLTSLVLVGNQLSGPLPDLSALAKLKTLELRGNQLSGPIPDLSALANLEVMNLGDNRLTGPIFNITALTAVTGLSLSNNQLSGPVPDLSALANLQSLDLSGNQLCLPAGYDMSGFSSVLAGHLNRLSLPTCTAADLAAAPVAPQNLTATIGDRQVTLSWDAMEDASGYDVWVWDSIDRHSGRIGGALTDWSFTHPVLTDGRNYCYRVRARNANGVRGAWSGSVLAVVVPQQFLPPPRSF